MNINGGNFFEKHAEKLVLAVVGILCLWLLFSHVLVSPNKIKYGNSVFAPSVIDGYIKKDAERLESKLDGKPTARGAYESKSGSFILLLKGEIDKEVVVKRLIVEVCPDAAKYLVADIVTATAPILPPVLEVEVATDVKYSLPEIGAVAEVSAEHFRMAVYEPKVEVDGENAYTEDTSETNDIDYVTVAGEFDIVKLRKSFHESFMGIDVNEHWRDPCFAKPVFSAVELQRQELLSEGIWSGWSVVPCTKIEARKELFRVVEDADDLGPGGVGVRRLQFEDKGVMIDLLQPSIYRIASAEEEWFPPALHRKFVAYQRQEEKRERRKAAEDDREEREREREGQGRYPGRGGINYGPGRAGGRGSIGGYSRGSRMEERPPGSMGGGSYGDGFGRSLHGRRPKRPSVTSTEKDILNELYDELEKIRLTEATDIMKLRDPITFWAHDDTVEPGKNYRYRIRIGIFNPVAGTGQVKEDSLALKNQVVLWSDFSKTTEQLDIPKRLYFFAHGIQEAAKQVTVKVSKYVKGYWYSRNFRVEIGELIGGVFDHEAEREQEQNQHETLVEIEDEFEYPAIIDYSTGAVLVDVGTVNSWVASRRHSEMLYSFDGVGIDHMSVGFSNWPHDIKMTFHNIELAEKRIRKPYQAFSATGGDRKRRTPVRGGEERRGDDEGRGDDEAEQLRKMMGL